MFEGFDHGEIEAGDYAGCKKKLELYIVVGVIFVVCFYCSLWRDLYVDVGPWTAAIYEAEKYYFLTLNTFFFLMFVHWLFASLQAYSNPRLVIDHHWQVRKYKINRFLLYLNFGTICLGFFVDLFKYLFYG